MTIFAQSPNRRSGGGCRMHNLGNAGFTSRKDAKAVFGGYGWPRKQIDHDGRNTEGKI